MDTDLSTEAQTVRKFWYLKVIKTDENFSLSLWMKNSKGHHSAYSTSPRNQKVKDSWGRIVYCTLGELLQYMFMIKEASISLR